MVILARRIGWGNSQAASVMTVAIRLTLRWWYGSPVVTDPTVLDRASLGI